MKISNSEIAQMLLRIGDLIEIQGGNEFRVRAYRNAARTLEELPTSVADMVEDGQDLKELPGIGEGIAGKIEEAVRSGSMRQLDELEQEMPPALTELLRIPGLGPKRVQALYKQLHVTTLAELEAAAKAGKIREVSGLGAKLEEKILEELPRAAAEQKRTRLDVAESIAEGMARYLKGVGGVETVDVAGSYRRRVETVGDLDILAISKEGAKVTKAFTTYDQVSEIVSQGTTKATVLLKTGMQIDLRVVEKKSYGAALVYFTGSKAHGIRLRDMAIEMGLKVNEYGVFRGDEQIAGATEKEVYDALGLAMMPPELREDRGEIEAAAKDKLPNLISLDDLRGDLQCHTTASDGRASLDKMVQAAADLGHEYLAITDHSPHVTVAQGLDAAGLAKRIDEIDKLNAKSGITILKSAEVDILEDGSLDYPDDILKELDFTLCSVHSAFDLSREKQTARILRAMDNPYFNILSHPTSRLIGRRGAIELDLEKIMEEARQRGCVLEINAQPERLDLNDLHCRQAKEIGVKLVISTDAHSIAELRNLRFGAWQARRGWLEAKDVINTHTLPELKRQLKRA